MEANHQPGKISGTAPIGGTGMSAQSARDLFQLGVGDFRHFQFRDDHGHVGFRIPFDEFQFESGGYLLAGNLFYGFGWIFQSQFSKVLVLGTSQ